MHGRVSGGRETCERRAATREVHPVVRVRRDRRRLRVDDRPTDRRIRQTRRPAEHREAPQAVSPRRSDHVRGPFVLDAAARLHRHEDGRAGPVQETPEVGPGLIQRRPELPQTGRRPQVGRDDAVREGRPRVPPSAVLRAAYGQVRRHGRSARRTDGRDRVDRFDVDAIECVCDDSVPAMFMTWLASLCWLYTVYWVRITRLGTCCNGISSLLFIETMIS